MRQRAIIKEVSKTGDDSSVGVRDISPLMAKRQSPYKLCQVQHVMCFTSQVPSCFPSYHQKSVSLAVAQSSCSWEQAGEMTAKSHKDILRLQSYAHLEWNTFHFTTLGFYFQYICRGLCHWLCIMNMLLWHCIHSSQSSFISLHSNKVFVSNFF